MSRFIGRDVPYIINNSGATYRRKIILSARQRVSKLRPELAEGDDFSPQTPFDTPTPYGRKATQAMS
jgi:hypothetical protein